MSCTYTHANKGQGEGIHTHGGFGFAYIDTLIVLGSTGIVCFIAKWNYWAVLLFVFLFGIILHRILSIDTVVGDFIFKTIPNFFKTVMTPKYLKIKLT